MDIALALQPHRPELWIGAVGLGIFGEAEAERRIEVVARLHVRREAVEMIDALDARALIGRVFLQHGWALIHLRIEIERRAENVGGAQGAALIRHVRERGRQIAAGEPGCGAIDVVFTGELEAERAHVGVAAAPQHDRMMVALLDAAQIKRVIGLVADQKAEAIDIKGARARKVAHAKLDMARAHHIERRVENRLVDGHRAASWPLTVWAMTLNTSSRR